MLDAPIMTTTLPYNVKDDLGIFTPELIEEKFGNMVDLVVDGGISGIEPSTIVYCVDGDGGDTVRKRHLKIFKEVKDRLILLNRSFCICT